MKSTSNKLLDRFGRRISRIGLGTVQFGMSYGYSRTALSQEEVDAILNVAHENSITFLDTAREYGDSEGKIRSFCRRNPEKSSDFLIATKFSHLKDDKTPCSGRYIRDFLRKSLDESKKELGKNELPLVLVHQTDRRIIENPDFWNAIEEVRKIGVAACGVSVYEPPAAESIVRERADLIDCIQAPFSVVDRRFEALAGLLRENGIAFVGRSTFLQGALTEKDLPENLAALRPVREALGMIAREAELSVPEILELFSLSADFIDCTLIGVRSADQLKQNLHLMGNFEKHQGAFLRVRAKLLKLAIDDPLLIDPRKWSRA